jgi:hypothetical protein
MANYFDRVLYLYPGIQGVMYWQTQPVDIMKHGMNPVPWDNPYDGLVWENTIIKKPTQAELDALDDATVEAELARREMIDLKNHRDQIMANDLNMKANYKGYKKDCPEGITPMTFSEYLDHLEAVSLDD